MNGEHSAHLPSSLRKKSADPKRRLRSETRKAACSAISWLSTSYLVLFVSDRLWDTPPWLRMLLLGASFGSAIYQIALRLKLRIDSSQGEEHPTTTVPRHDRSSGLCSSESVTMWRGILRTALLPLLAMALLFILPEASRSTFFRWLIPVSQNPRFTFVRIEGLPEELVVARSEPFELRFDVAHPSFWQPKTVTALFPGESVLKTRVSDGKASFEFAGQTEPRPLILRAGDSSLRLTIIPLARPQLTKVAALVSPPPHLRRPPMAQPIEKGKLHVIEGSRIVLKGLASRSLKRAWLNRSTRLSVAGTMFLTEEFEVSKDEVMTLTWEDWHGLRAQKPMQITIVKVEADQPPKIAVKNPYGSVAMHEDANLTIKLSAGDDRGLKENGLSFESLTIMGTRNAAFGERTWRKK